MAQYEWTRRDRNPGEPAAPTEGDLKREAKRVVRHFQRYTSEQRADHAASHRLGFRQRTAVGEFFYTHPDLPGRAFPRRGAAARAALRAQPRPA